MTKRREINQAEPEGDFDTGDTLPQPMPEYSQKVVKRLEDPEVNVRLAAAGELTDCNDETSTQDREELLQRAREDRVERYVKGISSRSVSVRLKSLRFLAKIRSLRAVKTSTKLLCDRSPIVRKEVVAFISQLGDRAAPGLITALIDSDIKVFKKVVELLLPLNRGKDVRRLLVEIMQTHAGPEFRAVAIQAMKHFNSVNVVGVLQQSAAEDPSPKNRASAARELRTIQKCSAQGNSALK